MEGHKINPVRMFDLIRIEVVCNDGNNGMFLGKVTSIHFFDCILTTSIWDDDGEVGTKIEFGKNQMSIFKNVKSKRNITIPVFKQETFVGSWIADSVWISRQSLADILNFLNRHSKEEWNMEEGISEIFDKWKNNKKFSQSDFIEVKVPLAVNKKEDGLPPPDKSGGIRPTIL